MGISTQPLPIVVFSMIWVTMHAISLSSVYYPRLSLEPELP